jgi:hypothetical protein
MILAGRWNGAVAQSPAAFHRILRDCFFHSPVKQYEFVRAAKTPISLEFSKEQRVAMMILLLLA